MRAGQISAPYNEKAANPDQLCHVWIARQDLRVRAHLQAMSAAFCTLVQTATDDSHRLWQQRI